MKHHHPLRPLLLIAAFVLAWLPFSASANLPVYLELQINGADIEGEPVQATIGGDDVSKLIECIAMEHEVYVPVSSGGHTSGAPVPGTIKIVKRVDKATPLLLQGLAQGQIAEAEFHGYDNDPDSGETRRRFTITLTGGKIVSVRRWRPNILDPAAANMPHMEEVQFTFQTMTYRDDVGKTEYSFEPSPGS